jgi:membrane associated rhomboid family serine protease
MAYSTRDRVVGYGYRSSLPQGVKWLLIINVSLFILYFFTVRTAYGALFTPLKLIPSWVTSGAVWQLVTYLFLHSPFDLLHILFNMLTLWMIGVALENTWGTRLFLKYYFVCGIGAGICVVVASYLFGNPGVPTIGASGAIYGLLLAFGLLFPDATLFLFIFPVKAKYAVMILGAIAFLMSASGSGGTVSHIAHLGGLLVGYVYLKSGQLRLRRTDPLGGLRQRYHDWRRERAKRKFQVYMRKHGSDRDFRDWKN